MIGLIWSTRTVNADGMQVHCMQTVFCANGLVNTVYPCIQIDHLRSKRCRSAGCISCPVLFASGVCLQGPQFLQRKRLHEGKALRLKYFPVLSLSEIILIGIS